MLQAMEDQENQVVAYEGTNSNQTLSSGVPIQIVRHLLSMLKDLTEQNHELKNELLNKDVFLQSLLIHHFYFKEPGQPSLMSTDIWKNQQQDHPLLLMRSMIDMEGEIEGKFVKQLEFVNNTTLNKLSDVLTQMKTVVDNQASQTNRSQSSSPVPGTAR